MRGHKVCLLLITGLSLSCLLLVPSHALAYVGPGPGLELSSNFFSLLTWAGIALSATFLWPVCALLHRFWGSQPTAQRDAVESFKGAGCCHLMPLRATQPF